MSSAKVSKPSQLHLNDTKLSSVSCQRYSETDLQKTKRRAGTSGELGIRYEKKLLLLVLYRAIKMKYDFTLDTNIEGVGAFDDVVFTYKEGNGIVQQIYLQVKHKEDKNKKIKYEDFLKSGNDDYALYKYFIDYLEIIEKYDDESRKINKYFIIYTNIDFHCPGPNDEGLRTHKKSEGDYFMFRKLDFSKHRSLQIFSSIGCRSTKQHVSFYQFSDRNEANDENERARVVKVLMKRFKEIGEEKKCITIGKLSENELSSKLEGYLNALVFAVDQPSEIRLGNQIKEEINDSYPDSLSRDQVDFMFEYALNKIGEWKDRRKAQPLTEKNDYFKHAKDKFSSFSALYPVLVYENELSATNVEFVKEMYSELADFILSGTQLWVISSETPWLNSLVLYQALKEETLKQKTGTNYASPDHHLLLTLSDLLKAQEFIFTAFKAMGQSLLMIICESRELVNPMLPEITNKIIEIVSASKNNLKQVIVIATENNQLSIPLREKMISFYAKQPKKIDFCHLVGTSQDICLAAQKIRFQGSLEQFSIKQLLGLDESYLISEKSLANFSIDALGLERILKSSILEIGNEKLCLSELESVHFKTHTLIEISQLKHALAENSGDIFAFVGDKNEVIALLPSDRQQALILFEDGLRPANINFILLQNGREEEQFKQLCREIDEVRIEKEAKNNVAQSALHLLKRRTEGWIWVRTYSQELYMKRSFYPVVVDKQELRNNMSKLSSSDYFVFSGITTETLLKSVCINNENEKDILETTVAFLQESDAEKEFQRLRNYYNQQKSIHWLKVNTESHQKEFEWYRSEGKTNQLRSILKNFKWDRSEQLINPLLSVVNIDKVDGIKPKGALKEHVLVKSEARFIVLADEPGMGKSTTLVHMAELMKKRKPLLWVIKIDLNRYQAALATSQVETLECLVHLLSEIDRKFADPLTCSILMYKLTCPQHVGFLCDGFDEVKPERQEALLAFFEFLKNETAARVFVTTRRHDQNILEERLSVFAYPFQPLTKTNQIDFLARFWEMTLKLTHKKKDASVLGSYASEVIDRFERSIKDYKESFISIPLRARMLSEVYQDAIEKVFVENKPLLRDFEIEERLGITYLYRKFIGRKYSIYLREKANMGEGLDEESRRYLMRGYTKAYGHLAMQALFDPKKIVPFISDKKKSFSLNILSRIGLIQGNEEFMNFTHRTFMEYFAAKWLAKHAENEEVKKFLCLQLFKKESEVLRRFFDRFLTQDLLLHRSVLDGDSSSFGKLLRENCNVDVKDVLGRTALHLAAQESRTEMIKQLLEVSDDIFVRDHMGKTPLHYSVSFGNDKVVETLLKNHIDIDLNDHIFKTPLHFDTEVNGFFNNPEYNKSKLVDLVNVRDVAGKSLLYFAAQNEYWNIVCSLLLHGADCSVFTIEQIKQFAPFISVYFSVPNVEFIFAFLLIKFPEAARGITFNTKQHLLGNYYLLGHTKVIDVILSSIENEVEMIYLLNTLQFERIFQFYFYNMEMYNADDADCLKMVRYFNEQGRRKFGINISESMQTLLNITAVRGFLKSFKYLWQCIINIEGKYQAKYIQDNKANLINLFSNMHDFDSDDKWFQKLLRDCYRTFGWKRLHLAAMDKHASSIEGYLKPPLYRNINIRDKEGCTPLIYATYIAGRSDFIESLFIALKKNNINDKNKLYEIIKAEDQFGRTPLYWVVRNRDFNSTETLLKHIVDAAFSPDQLFTIINYTDNPNDNSIASVLFGDSLIDKPEFSELLIKYLKALNLSSRQWVEFLCVSNNSLCCFDSEAALILLNFIENLPLDDDHRATIFNRRYEGKTPLHMAAADGERYEVVCSLLRNGAIYNARDAEQQTPLDFTSEYLTSEHSSKIHFILSSVSRLFKLSVDEQLAKDIEKLNELKGTLKMLKDEAWVDPKCILNARNREGKTLLNLSKCQSVTDLLLEYKKTKEKKHDKQIQY